MQNPFSLAVVYDFSDLFSHVHRVSDTFPQYRLCISAIVNIILAQCVDFDCLSVSRSQTEFLRQ